MKRLKIALSISAAAFLIGCGGGSSSSVSGSVEASKLEGIKVCLKGSDNCAITDANGKFTLQNVNLPATLEIKIGNSVFADLNVKTTTLKITPSMLADNNSTKAAYIGAFLHKVAGCEMDAQNCSFSGKVSVDITDGNGDKLLDKLFDAMKDGNVSINVDGKEDEVNKSIVTRYENANPDMVSNEVSYKGAVKIGDFASFNFDSKTNKLTYNLSGSKLGQKDGNVTLVNEYKNIFFKDEDGDIAFFTKSLGVILTEYNNSMVPVVGLQMPTTLDTSLILNKRFNFIDISSDGIDFTIVDVNGSGNSGIWSDIDGNNGNWELNNTHLDACENNGRSCVPMAHFMIRPPIVEDGRAGIVVDNLDGGFSIGIEAKPITANEIKGTYYYEDIANDGTVCYGSVTVNGETFNYQDAKCNKGTPSSGTGSLILNPQIDPDGDANTDNNITLNGLAQVVDANGNPTKEYVFIDPKEGYYVSVDTQNGDISIGSNKPIK